MKKLLLILFLSTALGNASAYVDTTSRDFPKPQPMSTSAYKYKEKQVDKYIDVAAGRVAPALFSNMLGPVGTMINLSDKVIELQNK